MVSPAMTHLKVLIVLHRNNAFVAARGTTHLVHKGGTFGPLFVNRMSVPSWRAHASHATPPQKATMMACVKVQLLIPKVINAMLTVGTVLATA